MESTSELPLIWIKKIVRNRDTGAFTIEDDILRKADIKNARPWHKNEFDKHITGDIIQVTLERVAGAPPITIRVNESLKDFAERLGNVHQVGR